MFAVESVLAGWPLAVVICAGIMGFVSFFIGWPWSGIIIHKHYHNGEEDEE